MQAPIRQVYDAPVAIPAGNAKAVSDVERLEAAMLENFDNVHIDTHHSLHEGVYCRTMMIPQGHLVTGAQVNVGSTLIISGDITLYINGEPKRFIGYHVLPASAGRKQAAYAHLDTHVTMLCRTDAETVEAVEDECTDETDRLMSRRPALTNGGVK
tara:strand:+ start:2254 stop:2721 length:468 start_codon:yes stop_codon:yes gene_type:complete